MRTGHIKTLPDGTVCVDGAGQHVALINQTGFFQTTNAAETILQSVTIPAPLFGVNTHLFIQALVEGLSTSGAYYFKIRIGGLLGTIVHSVSGSPTGRIWQLEVFLSNRNLINAQRGINLANTAGGVGVNPLSTTVNFAAAQDLVLTGQCGAAATCVSFYLFAGYIP
jgi:hypothetical protein